MDLSKFTSKVEVQDAAGGANVYNPLMFTMVFLASCLKQVETGNSIWKSLAIEFEQ